MLGSEEQCCINPNVFRRLRHMTIASNLCEGLPAPDVALELNFSDQPQPGLIIIYRRPGRGEHSFG